MSRSLNKVTLIGSLGKDPEMRFIPNGSAVCNFSIATDESYNDKNSGQKVDKTEWHRISAFGKLAEIMGQYLKKGSKVYVEGKLQTREWEKDGIKRYTTEIIASEMLMLDYRGADTSDQQQTPTQSGYQQPAPQQPQQPQQQPQGGYQPPQGGYKPPQQPQQQGGYKPPQQPQQQGGYQPPQNNYNNGSNG